MWLTIEGVYASSHPLDDGFLHLPSPHTLNSQILKAGGQSNQQNDEKLLVICPCYSPEHHIHTYMQTPTYTHTHTSLPPIHHPHIETHTFRNTQIHMPHTVTVRQPGEFPQCVTHHTQTLNRPIKNEYGCLYMFVFWLVHTVVYKKRLPFFVGYKRFPFLN